MEENNFKINWNWVCVGLLAVLVIFTSAQNYLLRQDVKTLSNNDWTASTNIDLLFTKTSDLREMFDSIQEERLISYFQKIGFNQSNFPECPDGIKDFEEDFKQTRIFDDVTAVKFKTGERVHVLANKSLQCSINLTSVECSKVFCKEPEKDEVTNNEGA